MDADMGPLVADQGIDRLVHGMDRLKPAASAGQFGSKRSARSQPDLSLPPGPGRASPFAGPSSVGAAAHYQAPEAVKNPKPSAKWRDLWAQRWLGLSSLHLRFSPAHQRRRPTAASASTSRPMLRYFGAASAAAAYHRLRLDRTPHGERSQESSR